jgi:hypothetical protein
MRSSSIPELAMALHKAGVDLYAIVQDCFKVHLRGRL